MDNTYEARLTELGVTLPDAPAPAANYVPYVISGDLVFVSGQISNGPDGLILGKLGENMDVYCGTKSHPKIIARVDAEGRVEPGQVIDLHMDMNKVHIFESSGEGRNLSLD